MTCRHQCNVIGLFVIGPMTSGDRSELLEVPDDQICQCALPIAGEEVGSRYTGQVGSSDQSIVQPKFGNTKMHFSAASDDSPVTKLSRSLYHGHRLLLPVHQKLFV